MLDRKQILLYSRPVYEQENILEVWEIFFDANLNGGEWIISTVVIEVTEPIASAEILHELFGAKFESSFSQNWTTSYRTVAQEQEEAIREFRKELLDGDFLEWSLATPSEAGELPALV